MEGKKVNTKTPLLTDYGKIEVIEQDLPPLGEEEALIELEYGGICGTDVHIYNHSHPTAKPPIILGHEYSGRIVEINSNKRTDLKSGDLVTSHPLEGCGTCTPCLTGSANACRNIKIDGIQVDGFFTKRFIVPVSKIYKLNDSLDPRLGSMIEPLAVAVHDVRRSELSVGQDVFVVGAGPIGLLIALVARLAGARRVILCEVNSYRRELAESLGFFVFDPTLPDFEQKALDITEDKGYEIVFEASGAKACAGYMTSLTAQQGTAMVVGVAGEPYPIETFKILSRELKFIGVRIHPQQDFAEAVNLVNDGALNAELEKMITNIFPLDKLEDAIKFSIEDQEHFKVILEA